jgi:hypothetical protein
MSVKEPWTRQDLSASFVCVCVCVCVRACVHACVRHLDGGQASLWGVCQKRKCRLVNNRFVVTLSFFVGQFDVKSGNGKRHRWVGDAGWLLWGVLSTVPHCN